MESRRRRISIPLSTDQRELLRKAFGLDTTELIAEGDLVAYATSRATAEGWTPVDADAPAGADQVWVVKEVDILAGSGQLSEVDLEQVAGGGYNPYQDRFKHL